MEQDCDSKKDYKTSPKVQGINIQVTNKEYSKMVERIIKCNIKCTEMEAIINTRKIAFNRQKQYTTKPKKKPQEKEESQVSKGQ
jgi:hypothetical protein